MSSQEKYTGIVHVLNTPKKGNGLRVLILDSSSDLLCETNPSSSRNKLEI